MLVRFIIFYAIFLVVKRLFGMNRSKALQLPDTTLLRSFIRGRTESQADADDVLQDVYETYLEATDLGLAIESVGAWLTTVAKNKILDRFRKKKSEQNYEEAQEYEEQFSAGPEEEWTATWIRTAIVAAIEELPPEQREVFVLHELEGKSFEEISAQTGININTCLARKRYAILFLREKLKEIYDELE